MPFPHRRRRALDRLPVGDVADLVLAVELLGERAEPVLAPRDEDAAVAARGQLASDRRADPARGAGDDGDAALGAQRQTRTRSVVLAYRGAPASRANAYSVCAPRFALPAFHVATKRPPGPERMVASYVDAYEKASERVTA